MAADKHDTGPLTHPRVSVVQTFYFFARREDFRNEKWKENEGKKLKENTNQR